MNKDLWSSENVQNEILKVIKLLNERLNSNSSFSELLNVNNNFIFMKADRLTLIYMKLDEIINEISNRDDDEEIYEYKNKIIDLIITLLILINDRNNETTDLEDEKLNQSLKNYLKEIGTLLIQKNRKYGNAALNPCRIFSKTNKVEQLLVRCDDKLNRIKNRQNDEDEDPIKDLIGYLILILVCFNIEEK